MNVLPGSGWLVGELTDAGLVSEVSIPADENALTNWEISVLADDLAFGGTQGHNTVTTQFSNYFYLFLSIDEDMSGHELWLVVRLLLVPL
ncbi:hypothetical protein KEM54_006697 [Ascosphaera aggregata]|nr:hypothetical protein KEM54_006697 [Ascosphaera aggregata]